MRKLSPVFSTANLHSKNVQETKWAAPVKVDVIANSPPFFVKDYDTLVKWNAQILYRNRNITLLYRGQDHEHKVGKRTTIFPSIYRKSEDNKLNLKTRFKILKEKSSALIQAFNESEVKFAGRSLISKYPEIAWSILQHYEVCSTPLMDLTQSLHVAASFAFDRNQEDTGIIYVLGMPWINDAIGYNTYEELVNIRLLNVCPPQATRPFFQEGHLVGPFPNFKLDDPDRREQFDFARRLVAKFEIPIRKSFWGAGFGRIPKTKLYPDHDKIKQLCELVKSSDY